MPLSTAGLAPPSMLAVSGSPECFQRFSPVFAFNTKISLLRVIMYTLPPRTVGGDLNGASSIFFQITLKALFWTCRNQKHTVSLVFLCSAAFGLVMGSQIEVSGTAEQIWPLPFAILSRFALETKENSARFIAAQTLQFHWSVDVRG